MEDLSIRQLRRNSRNRYMTKGYNDVSLGALMRRILGKAEKHESTDMFIAHLSNSD